MNEDDKEMNNIINQKLDKYDRINKLKQEYLEVKSFMENLNSNLTVEIMVPIAENLAYFKGVIKHTNECTIFLGDDYFAKTVNKKAIDIIDNRIKNLDKISNQDDLICSMDNMYSSEREIKPIETNENVRKMFDGSFEIIENFTESEIILNETSLNNKTVNSIPENAMTKEEKDILWQEKIKRLKFLEALEDGEIHPVDLSKNTDSKEVVKSPKDIFNLMTNVKKQNEEIKDVTNNDTPPVIKHNIIKESAAITSDGSSSMKKVGKKKDIIDANFNNTIKNENEIKEKRSLFFEDNDN